MNSAGFDVSKNYFLNNQKDFETDEYTYIHSQEKIKMDDNSLEQRYSESSGTKSKKRSK